MGALSVDLTEAQKDADKAVKGLDKASAKETRLKLMRGAFISRLFKVYQWRLLLFARGADQAGVASPAADGTVDPPQTIWEKLVGTTRPKVAALSTHMDLDTPLSKAYGPTSKSPSPNLVSFLPKLAFDPTNGLINCTVDGKYGFYNYAPRPAGAGSAPKGWTQAAFYQYIDTPPAGNANAPNQARLSSLAPCVLLR